MPVIADLQLTISPYTSLYNNLIPDAVINTYETTGEGRNEIVLDFNAGAGVFGRDLGTIFQWPTALGTVLYDWQPSLIAQPEGVYGRATDWIDGGSSQDKFVQGITIEADTFGVAKTFQLQSADDLSLHPLLEMPATFNGQSIRSFSCEPFIAHSVRVVSTDGVEWRVWSTSLVFQPFPSACLNWQTEMVSLGGVGWEHVREMNIPQISTADLTLVLTFDAWPTITLTVPNSSGKQVKTKVTLPANKFKLIGLQLSSTVAFRLFQEDIELKTKIWGSTDAYRVLKPFGGQASVGATV
jgi:hypothetical protein